MSATLDRCGRRVTMQPMRAPTKPPSNVVAARNWHFQYLAERMRPDEIQHWLAVSGADEYSADVAAAGFIGTPGLRFTILAADGTPVATDGAHEARPGCWKGWLVGSMEGWETNWRSITKATRWLHGELLAMGARRITVETLASRTAATDWYRRALGMQLEGTFRRAGQHGEDMVLYARVAGDEA